jgi:hypothetical protein
MKKTLLGVGLTALYIIILFIVYWFHINFFTVNVVLYSTIFDAVIAVLLTGLVFFLPKVRARLTSFEQLQLVIIWVLTGYIYAISGPTVIDRSLSFYILEKIQQRGGGIEQSAFESVFTNEYMPEHRLVDVRLTEQLESGTIGIIDGCVFLTPRGDRLATFGRFFRQNFLPKRRLLMGEYSDDLTNPFRHSASVVDYQCSIPEQAK